MYCLLLVISDNALLPLSATGGGRKATNRFVCTHKTNKYTYTLIHQIKTLKIKHIISSRRASNERPYGLDCTDNCNVTLGRICFAYCKQSTRTGNGSLPIQIIKIITKQRSGRICFVFNMLSTRTGNGSLPIQTIKIITKQRSGEICFEFDKLSSRTENGGTPI